MYGGVKLEMNRPDPAGKGQKANGSDFLVPQEMRETPGEPARAGSPGDLGSSNFRACQIPMSNSNVRDPEVSGRGLN